MDWLIPVCCVLDVLIVCSIGVLLGLHILKLYRRLDQIESAFEDAADLLEVD